MHYRAASLTCGPQAGLKYNKTNQSAQTRLRPWKADNLFIALNWIALNPASVAGVTQSLFSPRPRGKVPLGVPGNRYNQRTRRGAGIPSGIDSYWRPWAVRGRLV